MEAASKLNSKISPDCLSISNLQE
uniref:Uncharacterized protein n=1 Tax=Rhizophora mucronata TaxID=61149 RepID=A0A2P2PNB0_RHIMU